MKSDSLQYRPDIDGARALAILGVVLFHLDNSLLRGGYAGVDVFFVISGYLITKLISDSLAKNTFSFSGFYTRRVRRLFPALFFMFALVVIGRLLLGYDENEFKNLGLTLIYACFQSANLLFLQRADYFSLQHDFANNPLLHTWSLAIEEHFYLLWPLILFSMRHFSVKLRNRLTILMFFASLACCLYLFHNNELKSAFYFSFARFWEILIGAILAFGIVPLTRQSNLNSVLGILGITLVGFSFWKFENTSFNPYLMLLPCLGAYLILYSGNDKTSVVSRVLSRKAFQFFGVISYSLYLLHWPMICFYKEFIYASELSLFECVVLFSTSTFLARLSYLYIETPFREKTSILSRSFRQSAPIFARFATLVVVFVGIGFGLQLRPPREWNDYEMTGEFKSTFNAPSSSKHLKSIRHCDYNPQRSADFDYKTCVIGLEKARPEVALLGDSHLIHYVDAVINTIGKNKSYLYLGYAGGNIEFISDNPLKEKFPFNRTHLLSAEWAAMQDYIRYVFIADRLFFETDEARQAYAIRFAQSVVKMTKKGKKVILLGQIPTLPINIHNCLRAKRENSSSCVSFSKEEKSFFESDFANELYREIASKNPNVFYFDPRPSFCNGASCSAVFNKELVYRLEASMNSTHLNVIGMRLLTESFRKSWAEGSPLLSH